MHRTQMSRQRDRQGCLFPEGTGQTHQGHYYRHPRAAQQRVSVKSGQPEGMFRGKREKADGMDGIQHPEHA